MTAPSSGPAPRSGTSRHVMPGAVIGERCNLGQNVVVMPRHPARQQREGPEQRLDLRGGDARGRRLLRPELRLHQRDQSAEPRVPEGRVPADAGPPRGHDRGQRHHRLRRHPRRVLPSSGPGPWSPDDVPAYALMVGVPARRIGWMCQCGVRLEVEEGRAVCGACGSKYSETGGVLAPIDHPASTG